MLLDVVVRSILHDAINPAILAEAAQLAL